MTTERPFLPRHGALFWGLGLLVVAALLLAPLFLVEIPPLLDYPNHLARMWIMARGHGDPWLSRMYGHRWLIIPNVAIDLFMPAMVRVMPLHLAGHIVLGLALMLPLAGTVLYSRAVFGKWSWWQLCVGLVSYNSLFLLGFMNFEIGLGLALLVAALWYWQRERRPALTVALTVVLALVTFFFHLFGVAFLGLLIGMRELTLAIEQRRWRGFVVRGAALVLVFAVPVALFFAAPIAGAGGDPRWVDVSRRLFSLFEPVMNYSLTLDRATGVLIVAFVVLCAVRGYARFSVSNLLCLAVLVVLFMVSPSFAKDTGYVCDRFAIMYGFVLFATMIPDRMPPWLGRVALAGFAALFVLRVGYLAHVWIDSRADVAELRQTIAPVRPGERVLVATVLPDENPYYDEHMRRSRNVRLFAPTFWHLAALLPIEHDAFWPLLFASENKQPVFARPPYDRISRRDGMPPDYNLLATSQSLSPRDLDLYPYLPDWQKNFDYVLIMPAGGLKDLHAILPDQLTLVRATDFAALFRVNAAPPHRLAALGD